MDILLSVSITLIILGALRLLASWWKWRRKKAIHILECTWEHYGEQREIMEISTNFNELLAHQFIYSEMAREQKIEKRYRVISLLGSLDDYLKEYEESRKKQYAMRTS